MGQRGPAPKRESERRRRNKPEGGEPEQVVDLNEVLIPDPGEGWHKAARIVWDSLARSGQSQFYTSSDWSTAWLLCESMSRELKPQPMTIGRGDDAHVELVELPPKGASLAAWLKAMAALMMTEGERRRARLELERPAGVAGGAGGGGGGDVAWLATARRRRSS